MNESNEGLESTESTENIENVETAAEPDPDPSAVFQAAPLLMGVKLPIRVLLGRTQLSLRDVSQLGSGSVVELDCSPNDPVEVIVNDKIIAHGEVVVVQGNYGVRITRIADSADKGEFSRQNELLNFSERLRG